MDCWGSRATCDGKLRLVSVDIQNKRLGRYCYIMTHPYVPDEVVNMGLSDLAL